MNHLEEIQKKISANLPDQIELIKQLVSVESPSLQPETQAGVQNRLRDALAELDYEVEIRPGETSGGVLIAKPHAWQRGDRFQMLVGHTDTVWPLGTLEKMPLVEGEKDGRPCLKGPGVFDMKTGIVMMVSAIRALKELGITPEIAPVLVINSDEEVGSRDSRGLFVSMAKEAERAYVLEPGKDLDGKIKTARKGVGKFAIKTVGVSAHAGLDPTKGASAIVAMANIIQQLTPLTDLESGVTVNPGVIRGGTRTNVIAAECVLDVDVRVPTLHDAEALEEAIRAIEPGIDRVQVEITGQIGPPMEATPRNQALWHSAEAIGQAMGVTFEESYVGGGSDGNWTSLHTATLDGLGAVGDGAHALHEFIFLDKLAERTTLLAMLLLA